MVADCRLLGSEFFLELLGRNPEEFFHVCAKVAVVEIAELFADVVQIHALADHALGEQGPVIAEQVLGFEAYCIFHMALKLNDCEAKYFRDSFDVEVVLFCKLKQVDAGVVNDSGSLAMKWCGYCWPAHE